MGLRCSPATGFNTTGDSCIRFISTTLEVHLIDLTLSIKDPMSSSWGGFGVHFNEKRGAKFAPHRDVYSLTLFGEAGTVTGRGHPALEVLSRTASEKMPCC